MLSIVNKLLALIMSVLSFIITTNALILSEIMYDPNGSDTGNEWVEVYNNGIGELDITNYKLFESNINHSINVHTSYTNLNGSILQAGDYAVIADNVASFMILYPNYTGKLYDSAFSLLNAGELLELKVNGITESSIAYTPVDKSSGTGGTLNYIVNVWLPFMASPGASSTMQEVTIESAATTTSTTSTIVYNTGYSSGTYRLGNIKMLVPKEMDVALGSEAEFFVKFVDSKDNILNANIYWSFGDGGEGTGATTTHRYYREGTYIAFVEGSTPSAYGVERIMINVTKPQVEIREVTSEYVSLYNKSDEDIDIGGFKISSDQGIFKLSRRLILPANKTITIDGNISGYGGTINNVKLLTAYNTLVFDYNYNKSLSLYNINIIASSTPKLSVSSTTKIVKPIAKSQVKNYKSLKPEDKIIKISTPTPMMSSTSSFVRTNNTTTVESNSSKFVKNWLYWLYD